MHDRGSDKVGSASRFVKIPDVGKRQLALSGIVLRGEDVQAAENLRVADEDLRLGPAIREFRPGTKVQYALFVYNARLDHDSRQTDLETRIQLFRRDQTVDGWNVSLYEFIRQIDTRSHLVNGYLQLAPQLEPGYYALQYVVTDKLASEKHGTTTGWTDFSVVH